MKKSEWVTIISALGAAAGFELNSQLTKKKKVRPFYAVTAGSIVAGIVANRLVPEDEPFTHQDYLLEAANKNVK